MVLFLLDFSETQNYKRAERAERQNVRKKRISRIGKSSCPDGYRDSCPSQELINWASQGSQGNELAYRVNGGMGEREMCRTCRMQEVEEVEEVEETIKITIGNVGNGILSG